MESPLLVELHLHAYSGNDFHTGLVGEPKQAASNNEAESSTHNLRIDGLAPVETPQRKAVSAAILPGVAGSQLVLLIQQEACLWVAAGAKK